MSVAGQERPLVEALTGDAEIARHFSAEAEIAAMQAFEVALAHSQAALGLLSPQAAEAIEAQAGPAVRPSVAALREGIARDGVAVPALVRAMRGAVGEAHGASVHLGATSQDAIDTGLMLRLRDVLALLQRRVEGLIARLGALAEAEGDRPLMAQTRMQAALPFTVSAKLSTWRRPLENHRERLAALRTRLPLQLGGPVGDGASFGPAYEALRADLAARLRLRDAAPWHSDRTQILDVAQGLALLAGTLGKIGQDVALMAQTGTASIRLSGGGGSSAMAHKQNPVGAEVLVALGRLSAGLLGTLAQSMIHENERSGAAWTLEWLVLPPMAEAAGAALLTCDRLLAGAQFVAKDGKA
ncbi:3-carboxy-cis,cis-muconate cycloisomerase [Aurantimonas sp. Leaf443]|uniref:3-carboxy-cis,cis-muconate cycloisomerase n=1 Tax=Aurantimonas sp. Leaf443 TaxID=1736378 RepID=UPI0006FEDA9E|nr:3-carboxy-cis,cis-muconate cycloisomerase [Aurantimonas sp. Leaf443]KQT85109.1 3-carboxy-cis,cis-muconate cycloisomerase [Aurantimonas sp. Leaf443]